ncbi:hypothetical protein [Rhodobacter sp. NSM]|uniref:hypothetical protein n=1 Tax=Rhodobacter sp. NSM TaxID=3457501 RepID=UPI003FD503CA
MHVTQMTSGDLPAWTLTGALLTVAGHEVDLEAEARDVQVSISLYRCPAGSVTRELGNGCQYLAVITIPPLTYSEAIADDIEGGEEGSVLVPTPDPLNVAATHLEIWAEEV